MYVYVLSGFVFCVFAFLLLVFIVYFYSFLCLFSPNRTTNDDNDDPLQ